MADRRAIAQRVLETEGPLVFAVTKKQMAARSLGDLGALLDFANEKEAIPKLVGRVVLLFPEYDNDPREVLEVPECKEWLRGAQEEVPFLALLVHPQMTFKMVMLGEIGFSKSADQSQVLFDESAAIGFMLDCGMAAYEFAMWQGLDAKSFAGNFLASVGLGHAVHDGLLENYAEVYRKERR